jgi:hypothetical protein
MRQENNSDFIRRWEIISPAVKARAKAESNINICQCRNSGGFDMHVDRWEHIGGEPSTYLARRA